MSLIFSNFALLLKTTTNEVKYQVHICKKLKKN